MANFSDEILITCKGHFSALRGIEERLYNFHGNCG
jgi:hypothetical protein